jgi:lysozyme family protein
MKQNYKIRALVLGSLIFAFFGFGLLISPAKTLADAQLGDQCSANSDCATGLFCDTKNGSTCETVVKDTPCSTQTDCQTSRSGLTCQSGQCEVPPNNSPNQYPIGQPKNGGSCGTTDSNIIKQIQGIVGVTYDGICGTETISGIQKWQQSHNLTDDGIVGPDTASAMGISLSSSGTTGTTGSTVSGSTAAAKCPDGLTMINGVCLPPKTCTSGIACSDTLSQFILTLVKILLTFSGAIAVVMVVIGGYWYMASGGNAELAEKGKGTILNFVIGLALIILAYTIVTIISSTLTGADKLIQ